ncbi:DUF3052 family protein [Altererythrobacter sp. MTPC7]|uniref:DUF3052 family protein n=1 Tax=Altererythrobacter sp. MTPC7 TaxID=3056567 RepID=UPI0036F1BB48
MTAPSSEAPLAKRLNLRDGQRCWFDGMPADVQDEIDEYALELTFVASPDEGVDAAHIFVTCPVSLTSKLADLRGEIAGDGQVWVSWPREGSPQECEVDEAAVREAGEKAGFVATKGCEIGDDWSALKFVIPKGER